MAGISNSNADTLDQEADILWKRAVETFRNGDSPGSLFLFKKLERMRYPQALFAIGNIYEHGGNGVTADLVAAEAYYKNSIRILDDLESHLALGRLYLRRGESNADYQKAKLQFEHVESRQSTTGSLFGLGMIHHFGLGVDRDLDLATDLYGRAVESGHILAEKNIAWILMGKRPIKGTIMWARVCVKIAAAVMKNPADTRLRIGFETCVPKNVARLEPNRPMKANKKR